MMQTLDFASMLERDDCSIQEAMIFPDAQVPFWHSTVLDKEGNALSSGFHSCKNQSRKIAIAEYLERTSFRSFATAGDDVRAEWGLHLIPTACGFAAGFNEANTVVRSISEAVERWTMSQWIDGGCHIDQISANAVFCELDPVSKFLVSNFEEVLFFRKKIVVPLANLNFEIEVAQTMGLLDNGIYPGSSAQKTGGSVWQHSLIESFRHLLFVRNNPRRLNRFPDDKIHFFSRNAEVALSKIAGAKQKDWPQPKISFHRVKRVPQKGIYLSRTILEGWRSWNEGPLERFLY